MQKCYLLGTALLSAVFMEFAVVKAAELPAATLEKTTEQLFDTVEGLIQEGKTKDAITVYAAIPKHPSATVKDTLDAADELAFRGCSAIALPLYQNIVTDGKSTASQMLRALKSLSTFATEHEFISHWLIQIAVHHPSATAAEKTEAIHKLREMGFMPLLIL